jgi:H+-transporting ATPase
VAEPAAAAAIPPVGRPEAPADPKPQAAAPIDGGDGPPDHQNGPSAKPMPVPTPQLVERVHRLYEELGREDVRAVEELEKAQRASRQDAPR